MKKIKQIIIDFYCQKLEQKLSVNNENYGECISDLDRKIIKKIIPLYKKYDLVPKTINPFVIIIRTSADYNFLEYVGQKEKNYGKYSQKLMDYLVHPDGSWGTSAIKTLENNGFFSGLNQKQINDAYQKLNELRKVIFDENNDAAIEFLQGKIKEAEKFRKIEDEKMALLPEIIVKPIKQNML